MIARYSRKEMSALWDERSRYLFWLKVELAASEEMAAVGLVPPQEWKKLKAGCLKVLGSGGVDPKRVAFHEKTTKHDVIAFTTALAELLGPVSRFVHFGLTSSDVVDTALSLQLQESGAALLVPLRQLKATLMTLAKRYKGLPCIGRSHGMFAEPTSFGLKFLGWYTEICRSEDRLQEALESLRFGKLSGAVGTNSHISVLREVKILKGLGLKRELVSTQVLPRDRIAGLMSAFAILAGGIERICVELRHLQRSEVGEVREGFSAGQKGSSAMPHKRNPISSENLTGCARMLRAYAQSSYENIALWHERDISHSSVERVFLPDSFILLDYALDRLNRVLTNLVVDEKQIEKNLESAGKISFSGHFLLALCKAGVSREKAYRWVQECALGALGEQEGRSGDFLSRLKDHPEIRKFLSSKDVDKIGDTRYQLREVDAIFKSVLSEDKARKNRK